MSEFRPTDEQAAIVEAARTGDGLVIEAGAGTGKTSTLKLIAAAKSAYRGVYLAYNKAIATEAQQSFPRSVKCGTAHKFAYGAVGWRYRPRLDLPRQPASEVARVLAINEPLVFGTDVEPLACETQARLALAVVERFCRSADREVAEHHVPKQPGFDQPLARKAFVEAILPLGQRAWADLSAAAGSLRFKHDYYMKMWQLTDPVIKADYILFDEAQDADPVIAAIVDRQPVQRILVGDANQAIYGWRGAIDAMSGFDGTRLALTQSFRFGSAIADEANKWLEVLRSDLRLTGFDGIESVISRASWPDAVLCRTNAGTILRAIHALDEGMSPALVGGGEEISRLAKAALSLQAGRGTDHPQLLAFRSWDQVKEYADTDEGSDLRAFVDLIERHGAQRVIDVVSSLVAEECADLVISTAHKAKGREWGTVRIADDFREPTIDPDATRGEQVEQAELPRDEAMLAYVSVTRAKVVLDHEGLAWVDPEVHWCQPAPRRATWTNGMRQNVPAAPKPAARATSGQHMQDALW